MGNALSNRAVSVIEQIQHLPVLPQVTMKITERMQSPTATLHEIAALIQSDVGLTSRILRLANSSYYSIPGGVSDVAKALQYLGFTTIAQIVLTSSVVGSFKTQGTHDFPLDLFWKHSFAVGMVAEITARSLQLPNAQDAFICGLMHDMGKLILLEVMPDQLHQIVRHAKEHQMSFFAAEQALELVPHTQLGVLLADHWKLPKSISACIHHHHDTFQNKPFSQDQVLIAWANQWVHGQNIGHSGDYCPEHELLEAELSQKISLNPLQKDHIQKKFEIEFEKAGAILSGHA